jgi:HD superfamily phosphohydrolase
MLQFKKWIIDTIHGYIGITKDEAKILDHAVAGFAPMQRLRRLNQLGWVHIAYPTATHTRFEHSLGTMFLAGEIGETAGLKRDDLRTVRIAALLHDIGHGPFSHDSEPVLNFFKGRSHEDMTAKMIKEYYNLEKYGLDTNKVANIATGKAKGILTQILFGEEKHSRLSIDADFLDYIVRDDFYSGARITAVDLSRIIRSFMVKGNNLVLHNKALLPVISAINARNHLALRVYFHKTSEFSEAMWVKAAYYAVKKGMDFEKFWLKDDYRALEMVKTYKGISAQLTNRLECRDINKGIVVGRLVDYAKSLPMSKAKVEPLTHNELKKIIRLRDDLDKKNEVESELAREFKVEDGHLILCLPAMPEFDVKKMESSIQFLHNDKVKNYEDYVSLESVCETNKLVYSITFTVPAKHRKRVPKAIGKRKIFKEIISNL